MIIKTESFSSKVGDGKGAPMAGIFALILKILPIEGRKSREKRHAYWGKKKKIEKPEEFTK